LFFDVLGVPLITTAGFAFQVLALGFDKLNHQKLWAFHYNP
jgi:hypothetical protein